jgi:hypothetical protein
LSFEVPSQAWLESYIRQTVRPRPAYEVSVDGLILSGATLIKTGTGSPESVVVAPPGSLYLDDGGAGYLKVTGTSDTGWKAITHA